MPLVEAGIFWKGNSVEGSARANRAQDPAKAEAASPLKKSRRVRENAAILFGFFGKSTRSQALFFFPRAWRGVLSQLALNGELLLCLFPLPESA